MNKTPDKLALLAELNSERDALDAEIETMIADMAEAPEEARRDGVWASNGASTRRYLELTNRQGDLEREIADLAREVTAAATADRPH